MNLQMLKNKAEEIEKAVHELLKEIRRMNDTDSNPSSVEPVCPFKPFLITSWMDAACPSF